jgi:membrane protease YdiL (CAAX protease family)
VKRELPVLVFAMIFPTLAAAAYWGVLGWQPIAQLRAGYGVCKLIQLSLPVLWLSLADRSALRPRRPSLNGVLFGIGFGLLVAGLILGLYKFWLATSPVFAGLPDLVREKLAKMGAATPAGFVRLTIFLSIIHSLFEEYYWRWFIYGRLRLHINRPVAMVLAGLAFMGHHVVILAGYFPGRFLESVLPFSLAIALGGIVWAWLYERSGSLLGPWLSHLIVDAALMAVGYQLAFGAA